MHLLQILITALILASLAFMVFTYFGYPLILWLMTRGRPSLPLGEDYTPPVTVVIAAFNEAHCIGDTLQSILGSDYPPERLDVVVSSDASDDGTDEVVSAFPAGRVTLHRQTVRQGQSEGLRRAGELGRGEILIAADASGVFFPDTVRRLARPFQIARVGAVSGHKVIRKTGTTVSKGDGFYLRYDTLLRSLESQTGSSWVGCQGGLFAVRKPLFKMDFPHSIAADNATCYELFERGYRHLFDPEAKVTESPSQDLPMEFRRKVRIIVLGMRGILFFRRLLVPWKNPGFFFQNLVHKVFRWMVPFALIVLWVASAFSTQPWAYVLYGLQCVFYALAAVGVLYGQQHNAPKWLSIPAYFSVVNLAGLCAWGALTRDYTLWKPPARDESSAT